MAGLLINYLRLSGKSVLLCNVDYTVGVKLQEVNTSNGDLQIVLFAIVSVSDNH